MDFLLSKYGWYLYVGLATFAFILMGQTEKIPKTIGRILFVIQMALFLVVIWVRTGE